MNINGVTDAQRVLIHRSLARSVEQPAAVRVRRVLCDERIAGIDNVESVRSVLLEPLVADRVLREFVETDEKWEKAFTGAFDHVADLKTAKGKEVLLVKKAAALIKGVAETRTNDVVGAGDSGRVSEARKRMITAVVGVEVMRALWLGKDSIAKSNVMFAAELLTKDEDVAEALKWAHENRIVTERGKNGTLVERRAITSLSEQELKTAILHYGDAIAKLVEEVTGYPVDPWQVMLDDKESRAKVKAERAGEEYERDDFQEGRIARKDAAEKAAVLKATRPRKVMHGLKREFVGQFVADLILSASNIVWSQAVTRDDGTFNSQLWLAMLRGALGLNASHHITQSRLDVFGIDTLKRLNEGVRLSSMLSLVVSWDGIEKQRTRLEEVAESSKDIVKQQREWTAWKDAAEETLNSLIHATGKLPAEDATDKDRQAWTDGAIRVMEYNPLGAEITVMMARRLERRMLATKYTPAQARYHSRKVFGIIDNKRPTIEEVEGNKPVVELPPVESYPYAPVPMEDIEVII